MSVDEGLLAWLEEALAPLGSVTLRKMMGVAALYLDGTIFAILDEDQVWFKSDKESDHLWDAVGCERFVIAFRNGRAGTTNYRRAPLDVYDDPEAMQRWARLALEAGLRAPARKSKKPRKPKAV